MKSAREVSAKQIIDDNPVTASSDESISKIKNRMEEHDLRAIPVVNEQNRLEGVISYRELARYIQFNPETTSPQKMMHQPPSFDETDSLVELANLRINSGRKLMVLTTGEKLKGVIGDSEFLEFMKDLEEFKDLSSSALVTENLITVKENDSIDRARHKMLDNNISRLPVLDDRGEISGILDSVDILKMISKREGQNSGGTSGKRGLDELNLSGGSEKQNISSLPVREIMSQEVLTSAGDSIKVPDALEMMDNNGTDVILFTDSNVPDGILTVKDMVEELSKMKERKTVMVQLTGPDISEEKELIHNQIRKQLQGSLGRKLDKPEELNVRIKKADKEGTKHRYEINLSLKSEYGQTNIEVEDWNLMDSVDKSLLKLNRVIRDKNDKRKEHR